MSKIQSLLLTTVLVWLVALASSPLHAQNTAGIDQLIIKYHDNMQARMNRQAFRAMAARAVSNVTGNAVLYKRPMADITGAHVLKLPYPMSLAQAKAYAQQITRQNPNIDYVEPDLRRYVRRTVPNDAEFNQQWHLLAPEDFPGAANVVNAWDISTGKPEIVVAVLDEGMTDHADLRPAFVGGSLAESGYDMIAVADESGDGDGRDSNPANPGAAVGGNKTSRWHGTHVGGIIAARPDNGEFIAGVGWNTSLLAVRILSDVGGYLSDQVDGMLWAAGEEVPGIPDNPNPAHVLNMSVGSDVAFDCSRTEQNAINTIRARGTSIVVAAGNLNRNVNAYAPGNCDGVIAVTGVMPDGARAPYSNYGELVDIAAPGDKIHSTANTGTHAPLADGTKLESGTSQAAPQVAGVIALMLAANEKLLDTDVIKAADLPAVLEEKLKKSVRAFPVSIDGSDDAAGCNENQQTPCVCTTATCGAGLLDAQLALTAVTTRPLVKVGEDRRIAAEATVQLDGSASKDDSLGGAITRFQWEQIAGVTVTLSGRDKSIASFVAPAATNEDQVLRFKLTATDDVGLQSSAEVELTVAGTSAEVDGGDDDAGADSDTGAGDAGTDSDTGVDDVDSGANSDTGADDSDVGDSNSDGSGNGAAMSNGGGGSMPIGWYWLLVLGVLLKRKTKSP